MTQEIINIGAQPNDGEGDPLRTAFAKINNNFTQLFSTGYFTSNAYSTGLTANQVIFESPVETFTQGVFQINSNDTTSTDMPHKQFKNKIVIYARPTCPYCIGLLDFLKQNNNTTGFHDNIIYIEVDSESHNNIFSKTNILKNLQSEIKNHSTVPIVFYKGHFIGGSDTSKEYFTNIIKTKK